MNQQTKNRTVTSRNGFAPGSLSLHKNSIGIKAVISYLILFLIILSAVAQFASGSEESPEAEVRSPFELENVDLVVTDQESKEREVLYPGEGPYNFEVSIKIFDTLNSLEYVTLEIDADGLGVSVQWDQINDAFTEISDPQDHLYIGKTSTASENNGVDTWLIKFPLIFNWNFPEADAVSCRVISESFSGDKYSDLFPDVFDFENDLSFYGQLKVTDSDSKNIPENSWIGAFETLNWNGLLVIFQDSENFGEPISPSLQGLNFKLTEEQSGNFWLAPPTENGELSATINSGPKTIGDAVFGIELDGLPAGVELVSTQSFSLGIDAEPLEFFDHYPEQSDIYFKTTAVKCGIAVRDLGGSGVDENTLEYTVSIHGNSNYGEWIPLDNAMYEVSEKGDYVIITMDATFSDGTDNYIKWRGRDLAGNGDNNGYFESDDLNIKINLTSTTNYAPVIILDHPKDSTFYKPIEMITFSAMDSYDPDGDTLSFTWSSNISGILSTESFFQEELEPGTHEITLQVKDGQGHTSSKTVELTVEPREVLEPVADDAGGQMVWETPQATYGTFTLIFIALLYFFTGTEIGKYKFLGLAIPLYSKLTRRMVLDHETRGMIRGYIIANPGDHFTSIKKHIGLKNGTLAYHLKILERENIIKSHRDGIFKRFYPINAPVSPDMVHLSKQEMILNTIIENPGVSRKDLALAVGLSRQVVNYHSKGLIQAGLIRSEKYGKRIQYYATEPISS